MKQVSSGQSLTEYCFIGALILVASIGILLAFGGGFNTALASLKGDLQSHINGAANANGGGQNPQPQVDPNGPGQVIPPPQAGQNQFCTASGWCVNVPDTSNVNLAGTTGSLGGELSQQMADVIAQIALQLQQDPNTDPTLLNLVTQLANQGHTIGDEELRLANNCPVNSYCGSYEYIGVVSQNTQPIQDATTQFNTLHQQLQDYLATHPNALPPEMQNTINFEAAEIKNISSGFSNQWDPNWNIYDGNIYNFNPPNGGLLTHQDANTICANGGNGTCYQMP